MTSELVLLVSDWVAVATTYGILGGIAGGALAVFLATRIVRLFKQ
jgi:hypothetical protein